MGLNKNRLHAYVEAVFRKRHSIGVIRTGFEPVTDRLEICCSIQLSYRTFHCADAKV